MVCVRASGAVPASSPPVHWSLQPIQPPPVPSTDSPEWVRNPLDAFVLRRLQQAGLKPSPEADRLTQLRRLYFLLIGLPPTPEETDRFLNDSRADAYERIVDHLLASPQYGERWARHWLDGVRYTESQGFEFDRLRENAWHYRDYVIQSFNADKPYDQFMKEQSAGDVMLPVTPERIIATSLLVCGPWDEAGSSQANVAQRMTTREEEMEDMISVVGQTFLGLTVNCARCHDHKFDPIPQTDYFRIKAVFDGVRHGERTVATTEQIAVYETQVRRLKSEIQELDQEISSLEWAGVQTALAKRPQLPDATNTSVQSLVGWDFASSTQSQGGTLFGPARISGSRLQLPTEGAYWALEGLPREVRAKSLEAWVSLSDLGQAGGGVISIETDGGRTFDALVYGERQSRKWMAGSEGFARTRELTGPEETTGSAGWIHMVATYSEGGEVAVYRNGEPYGTPYKPTDSPRVFPVGQSRLLLGMRHTGGKKPFLTGSILRAALYDRALSAPEVAQLFRSSNLAVPHEEALASLSVEDQRTQRRLLQNAKDARRQLAELSSLPVSYAGNREQPPPTRKLKRGDVSQPAEVVTPGVVSAVGGSYSELGLTADAPEGQRRLKFAEWLASSENPLPARVMVNRLWHFHFGQGLVSTPNDFGKAGSPPSHPELLDWLAAEFIRSGWSVKAIQRLIVTSSTYRMDSSFREEAARIDSENQWLWRFSPRRLEAEAIRDAMLSVSGEINLAIGGPSFRPFEVVKFPANAYEPTDKLGPEYNRRSIYRMNVNSGKEPLLDTFDCPDPSVKTPKRGTTSTALQALALMNNPFIQRQADRLARRSQADPNDSPESTVDRAYRFALGRWPSVEERLRGTKVVQERGLTHLCWALLNSTEFIYVR